MKPSERWPREPCNGIAPPFHGLIRFWESNLFMRAFNYFKSRLPSLRQLLLATGAVFLCVPAAALLDAADLQPQLETIRSAAPDGSGSAQAAEAWKQIANAPAEDLPSILAAIDNASPLAANWLRTAVDAIAERTLADNEALPVQALREFTLDREQDERARRLAYEWLRKADRPLAEELVPDFLNDPSVELRRDAVERLMEEAQTSLDAGENGQAVATYRRALTGARDIDQIKTIVERLRGLDGPVNLPRHFGFLMHWQVIGPFDNSELEGFTTVYPPEREFAPDRVYDGKEGKVAWKPFRTKDAFGMVDMNKAFGNLKEVVAYARAEFDSEREQQVELRLGCKNAWKVWLNDELLFARDEYHRGIQIDQYRMPATLRPGKNVILVKVCQNEQTETWTVEWQFQIRVCDSAGTAVLSTTRREDSAGP